MRSVAEEESAPSAPRLPPSAFRLASEGPRYFAIVTSPPPDASASVVLAMCTPADGTCTPNFPDVFPASIMPVFRR